MKVVVAIASHHRAKPLNIVLRCLPEDWEAVVVVTDPKDAEAINRPGTHVFLHPNEPLGSKWQRAVDEARKLNPDLLVITGSDDVILGNTEELARTMEGHEMLVFTAWTIFDGKQHYDARYNELRAPHKPPIGGGRVYTKALLDKMRWRLFDVHKRIHMDDFGWQSVLRLGVKPLKADKHEGIDIIALKGPWAQLNSLERLRTARHITITPLPDVRCRGDYQF